MLRVGLTGGLGSGKSAVALVLAEGGAHVLSADDLGRALMQPGEPVYQQIVDHFGSGILAPDGRLDRRALARQAFQHGRLAELNAIVHPAVFAAEQQELSRIAALDPQAIAVLESALVFEVSRGAEVNSSTEVGRSLETSPAFPPRPSPPPDPPHSLADYRQRFDKLILVTAPDELKIARYLARVAPPGADQATRDQLTRDARARLAAQLPDAEKAPLCDYVIDNSSTLVLLRRQAQAVLAALRRG